jgi:hypothetical protein
MLVFGGKPVSESGLFIFEITIECLIYTELQVTWKFLLYRSKNRKVFCAITFNGPAIWGGCVTRRSIRPRICPGRPESCHGARRVWRGFCKSRYKFCRSRACRGTSLIGASKLSRYRIFVRGTSAVSRYKLSRSQKTVKMQNLNYGQMRVSGCKFWQDLSWEQGAAKTMTNNLPILSVLWVRVLLIVLL